MVTTRRHILLLLFKIFDVAVAALSLAVATVAFSGGIGAISAAEFLELRISVRNLVLFAGLILLWLALSHSFGLYESKRLPRRRNEAFDVFKATTLTTAILFAAGVLFHWKTTSLLFLSVFWLMSTLTVVLSRWVLRFALQEIRLRGRNVRHILIVGTNPRALQFADSLRANPALGYRVVGFVDRNWTGIDGFRQTAAPLLCDFDGFLDFIRNNVVDEVVIVLPIKSLYPEASLIAALCEEQGITTHVLSNLFDLKRTRPFFEPLSEDSLITLPSRPPRIFAQAVKRLMDIAVSLVCILICTPVFLVVAVLIKLNSRGPVWFVQTRVGLNKRLISVYKFRTMIVGAEQKQAEVEHMNEAGGPVFKIKNDPRITTIGKFLRKTSIDELPQLFNVLKGDMSLVGPRPLPVRDYRGFEKDWQRRRFSIRPGITCLWQVSGRSSIQFDRWMELDMEYIDHWSVLLDLEILVRTIPAVLRGSGAS